MIILRNSEGRIEARTVGGKYIFPSDTHTVEFDELNIEILTVKDSHVWINNAQIERIVLQGTAVLQIDTICDDFDFDDRDAGDGSSFKVGQI